MSKPSVLFVGGLDFNIPKPMLKHFEVVKHIQSGNKTHRISSIPKVDYVFILGEFINHAIVDVIADHARSAGIPVVRFRRGWGDLKTQLVERGFLREEKPKPGTPALPTQRQLMAETLVGLQQDEAWETYGEKVIQAALGLFTPSDRPTKTEFFDAISEAVGLPFNDVLSFLPDLAMRGIVVVEDGHVVLTVGTGMEFGGERPRTTETGQPKGKARPRTGKMKAAHLDAVIQMAGLPHGPYYTKGSLVQEMNKYTEFLTKRGWPFRPEVNLQRIAVALEMGVAIQDGASIRIVRDVDITLHKKEGGHE